MNETLKMMKSIILGYEKNLTLEELLTEYKQTLKPNILAYLFVKNFGGIYNIGKNYTMLTEDDKISFCLQELDLCIHRYSFNRNCSFITYFFSCYKNKLRMEEQQLLTDIRYSNYVTENIDNCLNLCDNTNNFEVYDYINNCLTEKEVKHCKLLYMGYTNKELSSMFKVSVQHIYQINKKIGKKLLNLV